MNSSPTVLSITLSCIILSVGWILAEYTYRYRGVYYIIISISIDLICKVDVQMEFFTLSSYVSTLNHIVFFPLLYVYIWWTHTKGNKSSLRD